MNDMQKVALVAGASGLVGQRLVTVLCEAREYSRVYALTRRPLTRDHQKLANRVVRFADLEMQLRGITCSEAFCCLGTTRREAGSEAAFRQVDFELVLAFARAARAAQAQRFVLVSSVGADADSRSLYLRVKAQTEAAVMTLGFPALDIMQPGLLLGSRREVRPLELAAQWTLPVLAPLMFGRLARWRPVGAATLAGAMLGAARSGRRGVARHTWPAIGALADRSVRD
ncbi:MAG TPA: NAD-dependent epimerase/dehydratase family protein [Steroidobacteraceae bacterium]|nr:NAD-dependent epimerase/dehydratase family protein [Steroidobacteraceae bacterium]HQX77251.1 NAD-dependent epimerase/dehydratase family protein [Steroidobacteraceae bacterium]